MPAPAGTRAGSCGSEGFSESKPRRSCARHLQWCRNPFEVWFQGGHPVQSKLWEQVRCQGSTDVLDAAEKLADRWAHQVFARHSRQVQCCEGQNQPVHLWPCCEHESYENGVPPLPPEVFQSAGVLLHLGFRWGWRPDWQHRLRKWQASWSSDERDHARRGPAGVFGWSGHSVTVSNVCKVQLSLSHAAFFPYI